MVSIMKALSVRGHFDLSAERDLEIGANHPIATSLTYLLSVELGEVLPFLGQRELEFFRSPDHT